MKILILTDSLGLARETPEVVQYADTWVSLLRNELKDCFIHQVSIGGSTLYDLLEQYSYYRTFNADLIIVQAGIVECAPRALTPLENKILNLNSITKKFGKIFISPWISSLRKHRNIVKRSLSIFISDLNRARNEFGKTAVIYIPIMPPQPAYEVQVPGITRNVNKYNKEIATVFQESMLPLDGFPENGFMSDHHHLNKQGHLFLLNNLLKKIKEVRPQINKHESD